MNIRKFSITLEDGFQVSFDLMHGIIIHGDSRPLTKEEYEYFEHLHFLLSHPLSLT